MELCAELSTGNQNNATSDQQTNVLFIMNHGEMFILFEMNVFIEI